MDALHLITVRETADAKLTASGAEIVVRIAGQSFFTGNEAFKKAAEVADCVAELKKCGLTEEHITLASVTTEIETGILTKSSSAVYHLLVRTAEIEQLGSILTAISSRKNSKIVGISWRYPDLDQSKNTTMQNAVRAAKSAANQIAAALGTTLSGIHKLSYELSGLDTDIRVADVSSFGGRARTKAAASGMESLNLFHTTQLVVTVTAEFMVDTFPTEGK